jgi:hypothetical protein
MMRISLDKIVRRGLPAFLLAMVMSVAGVSDAFAGQTLGNVIENTVTGSELVPGLFTGFAYLIGLCFGVWGIHGLYIHVQNPNQNPVWPGLQRLLAGGMLFALPIMFEAAQNTITAGPGADTHSETGWSGATTGFGLDTMMTSLMNDVHYAMNSLIVNFAYLAAFIFVIIGIVRLTKSMQEGPRGPGGFGTIMTFVVAGALFSLNPLLAAFDISLFQDDQVATFANLAFTGGMTAAEVDHVHAVISSVLAFMMILGWISFVRGWFIIRDVAEGDRNASLMAGLTHLFGGALAVNLGPLMNAVQETFGLTAFGVNFT